IVAKTRELLPEPETPVNTVRRRLGNTTLTSRRLFSRAPCTRIASWLSATCEADGEALVTGGAGVVAMRVSLLWVAGLTCPGSRRRRRRSGCGLREPVQRPRGRPPRRTPPRCRDAPRLPCGR